MIGWLTLFLLVTAIVAILSAASSAKKRAVVDYILKEQYNKNLNKAKESLKKLSEEDTLSKFAAKDKINSQESHAILTILNFYEFIASAIYSNAFDQGVYKKYYTRLVKDYQILMPFVKDLRLIKEQETLFQEFEKMGKNWSKNPLKIHA